MADGSSTLVARTVSSIEEIGEATWDRLSAAASEARHPFISYAFLQALEISGSVCSETGWTPFYVAIESNDKIVGIAPLYVKMHSQGEYVFDHHWADAYKRAGGRYYPKLVCAAPFTPVPGPRLLAASEQHRLALGLSLIHI